MYSQLPFLPFVDLLACRIPPPPQQGSSPLLKSPCLGVSPEHFDLFSLTKLLVAGRVFRGPRSLSPPSLAGTLSFILFMFVFCACLEPLKCT